MFSLVSFAGLTMLLGSAGALRHSFNSSTSGTEGSFLTQASARAPFTAYCQWRQTGGCSPTGPRQPGKDKPCTSIIPTESSGFCDCNGNGKQDAGEEGYNCDSTAGACLNVCQLPCNEQSECELLPDAVCDGSSCKIKPHWPNFGGEWYCEASKAKLTIKQDWNKITFIPQSGSRTSLVVGGGWQESSSWGTISPTWDGDKLVSKKASGLRGHGGLDASVTWYLETPQKLVEFHWRQGRWRGEAATTQKSEYTCVGGACVHNTRTKPRNPHQGDTRTKAQYVLCLLSCCDTPTKAREYCSSFKPSTS